MTVVMGSINVVSGLLVYGLLGNSSVVSLTTSSYGMSLTSFLVSGIAFAPVITSGLGLFTSFLYPSQLETVMTTTTGFRKYLMLNSVLPISINLGSSTVSFVAGVFLFGLNFSYNIFAFALVIMLGVATALALGLVGAAFQLVFKQTAVLSWFLFAFTGIAGNMLVPSQVLPGSVQVVSYLLPQYYFFTGIRVALGSDAAPLVSILLPFGLYAILLNVCGFVAVSRSLVHLRQTGTYSWS